MLDILRYSLFSPPFLSLEKCTFSNLVHSRANVVCAFHFAHVFVFIVLFYYLLMQSPHTFPPHWKAIFSCMQLQVGKARKILMKHVFSLLQRCLVFIKYKRRAEELQLIPNRPALIVLISLCYLSNNSLLSWVLRRFFFNVSHPLRKSWRWLWILLMIVTTLMLN